MFLATLVLTLAAADGGPIANSPDGKRVLTANGATLSVLDAATGKEIIRIKAHTDDVTAVAFSPDGKLLLSTGKDKVLNAFDAATGKQLWKTEFGGVADLVVVSPDGKKVIASQKGKDLATLDAATGKILKQ